MQAIFGVRTAATINLVLELLILLGLYVGFYYACRKKFRPHHANIQATMVLLNLVLILSIMVPSFYSFVILGGTTTGTVGTLMIIHAILGAIAEGVALYLVFSERFKIIPKSIRIKNIKPVMRSVLALWTIVVILGIGIYYFRYLAPKPEAAPAVAQVQSAVPALKFQADTLQLHAQELKNAGTRSSDAAVRRHSEHLVDLIVGSDSVDYGDLDNDGVVEDPGDRKGMLNYLQLVHDEAVAAGGSGAAAAASADAIRLNLLKIVADSKAILGAPNFTVVQPQIQEILVLSNNIATGSTDSVPQIAQLLGSDTTRPTVSPAQVQSGTITVDMKDFVFAPKDISIKQGTTLVFVNQDNAKHTVTEDTGAFNSKDIDAGKSFSFTFDKPGTFAYHCEYHGDVGGVDMAGTITVTP